MADYARWLAQPALNHDRQLPSAGKILAIGQGLTRGLLSRRRGVWGVLYATTPDPDSRPYVLTNWPKPPCIAAGQDAARLSTGVYIYGGSQAAPLGAAQTTVKQLVVVVDGSP